MPVISVINYKGGVGKTTLTANVAAELAYRGYDVLMLDMDAQASLTFSYLQPDYWESNLSGSRTIKSWFDSFDSGSPMQLDALVLQDLRANRSVQGALHLIPSHLGLINVDLELATALGGGSLKQAKRNYLRVHRRLADGLSVLADGYDVILIDCPPNFNVVTKTAIVASDHILIPAKADYLSTLGIDYLQRSLSELVEQYNEYVEHDDDGAIARISPNVLGVVFTMIQIYGGQPISALRPYIAQTRSLGVPVFDAMVRENKTLFGEAPQYGVPVVLGGGSRGATIVGELEDVVDELQAKAGL